MLMIGLNFRSPRRELQLWSQTSSNCIWRWRPMAALALCFTIFNLSPTQKTCLFINGNKASVCGAEGSMHRHREWSLSSLQRHVSRWCKGNDCSRSGAFWRNTSRKNKMVREHPWKTSEIAVSHCTLSVWPSFRQYAASSFTPSTFLLSKGPCCAACFSEATCTDASFTASSSGISCCKEE